MHGPDGPTDPDQRWCATLDGSGFIPFTSFNTECWSGSGQPYAGEPLATAMVLVPGEAASPVPYDFCLDGLVEAGAPAVLVPSAEGNLSVDAGYVVAGDWQGYAWTARDSNGSIIEPSDLSTVSGTALCAAGSVAPSENWDGWAMLGVELNQADDGSTPGTIVPTAAGLLVGIDNVAGSELRVQIQGPNGATEPNERWCAALTGSGVVPWNHFNTECWSGEGIAHAGEPLESVAIMVPGDNMAPVDFAFCLKNAAEQGTAKPGHGPKPRPPLGHHGNNSSAGGSGGCRTWPALPRWSGGHSAWSHRGPSWLRPMRHAWR